MTRTLVAGVGNIFLSDDAFGVEVVRRLATVPVPDDVTVADFGIRGHPPRLRAARGLRPPDPRRRDVARRATRHGLRPRAGRGRVDRRHRPDAHGMEPMAVFAYLASIGGGPIPTTIVGCEPASLDENMGLSEAVEGAVDEAVERRTRSARRPATVASSDVLASAG